MKAHATCSRPHLDRRSVRDVEGHNLQSAAVSLRLQQPLQSGSLLYVSRCRDDLGAALSHLPWSQRDSDMSMTC